MIGSRTLAALGVACLAVAWAAARGVINLEYLLQLQPSAALIVGLFASLAVVVVIALWHPDGASVFAIGVHRGRLVAGVAARFGRRARDLPLWGQRLLYLCAFLAVGLGSFGNAAASDMSGVWDTLTARGSEFCREAVAAPIEVKKAPAADQRGCALIRRAYELGYEKSLGSCAPKDDVVVSGDAPIAAPCLKRQKDEPLLHYTWRRLVDRADDIREGADDASAAKSYAQFKVKLSYARELSNVPKHAILGSPHASHHVFTNLPSPRSHSWISSTFGGQHCSNPAQRAAPSTRFESTSELLESAIGQLVLNPRYGAPALSCDELTIHWGSSLDVCDRLIANPASVLNSGDAGDDVRAVIERHQSLLGRYQLAGELGDKLPLKPPPLARVVSLSCLLVGDAASRRARGTFEGQRLDVQALAVNALSAEGVKQLEVYQLVARLLSGARYLGEVDDRAPTALRLTGDIEPTALDGDDFSLSRLELLSDSDPFLGESWPLARDDLSDVYPFESHLRRVVVSFRRRYRRIRGRL